MSLSRLVPVYVWLLGQIQYVYVNKSQTFAFLSLRIFIPCTVLSAGFSILCTGNLQYMECTIYVHVLDFFPRSIAVNITVFIPYLFYLPIYCTFPVVILCAGILQRICWNSYVLSAYSVCYISWAFFTLFIRMWYGLVVRTSVSCAAGLGLNPARCIFKCLDLQDFSGKWTVKYSTSLKGAVSQDFWPFFYFTNRSYLGRW